MFCLCKLGFLASMLKTRIQEVSSVMAAALLMVQTSWCDIVPEMHSAEEQMRKATSIQFSRLVRCCHTLLCLKATAI